MPRSSSLQKLHTRLVRPNRKPGIRFSGKFTIVLEDHPWAISRLQRLLDFRYTTGFRTPTSGSGGLEPYVYVGDAELREEPYYTADDPYRPHFDLSPFQLAIEPPASWLANGRIHAEFLKCALRTFITHRIARGHATIIVCLLEGELEVELRNRFAETRGADVAALLPPERLDDLLRATAAELESGISSSYDPLILIAGTPDVALALHDLICGDFPEVRVIHTQMVTPNANIQPIARISLTQRSKRRAWR